MAADHMHNTASLDDKGFTQLQPAAVSSLTDAVAALEFMLQDKFTILSSQNGDRGSWQETLTHPKIIHSAPACLAAILEMLSNSSFFQIPEEETQRILLTLINSLQDGGRESSIAVFWLTEACAAMLRHNGDREFAQETATRLAPILEGIPRHEKTGLLGDYSTDQPKNLANFKLRPSLLFAQACRQLAEIWHGLEEEGTGDHWHSRGQHTEKNVRIYFWNKKLGLFRSHRSHPEVLDPPGSALAVFRKTATSGQLMTVSRMFNKYCEELFNTDGIRQSFQVSADSTPEANAISASKADSLEARNFSPAAIGWFAYTVGFVADGLCETIMVNTARELLEAENLRRQQNSADDPASAFNCKDMITACRAVSSAYAIQERRELRKKQNLF